MSAAMLRSRLSVRIGLISYSLYLMHWPVFVFYKYWKFAPLSLFEKIHANRNIVHSFRINVPIYRTGISGVTRCT